MPSCHSKNSGFTRPTERMCQIITQPQPLRRPNRTINLFLDELFARTSVCKQQFHQLSQKDPSDRACWVTQYCWLFNYIQTTMLTRISKLHCISPLIVRSGNIFNMSKSLNVLLDCGPSCKGTSKNGLCKYTWDSVHYNFVEVGKHFVSVHGFKDIGLHKCPM